MRTHPGQIELTLIGVSRSSEASRTVKAFNAVFVESEAAGARSLEGSEAFPLGRAEILEVTSLEVLVAVEEVQPPDRPVAAAGNFLAFEVEELISRDVVGKYKVAVRFQHSGKNDAVKHNVVFSDKMDQSGVGILPVFFPIGLFQLFRC